MKTPAITQSRLKELLHYDPATGVFTWRVRLDGRRCSRVRVGGVAGSGGKGYRYRVISIAGVPYQAHRLAWLYTHGAWPSSVIDHINGIKGDNRIANLRDVTPSENLQNQRRVKGYSWEGNCWRATIWANRRRHNLGTFPTKKLAHAAYLAAKRIHHPSAPIGCSQ